MNALKAYIFLILMGYMACGAGVVLFSIYEFFAPLGLLGFLPGVPAFIAAVVIMIIPMDLCVMVYRDGRSPD